MSDKEEVFLNSKQLEVLEHLASIDLSKINKLKKVGSRVGKFFDWLDNNVLSKTTKLWMYFLECAGVIIIFVIIWDVKTGLRMIATSTDELSLQKSKMYIDSITQLAPSLAGMVTTICGALPAVMGAFRSLNKKWASPTMPNIPTEE